MKKTELRKELEKVGAMSKEEFVKFFNANFKDDGCPEGLYINPRGYSGCFTVTFTNWSILQEMDGDAYSKLIDAYGEEAVSSYEEKMEKAHYDAAWNNCWSCPTLEDSENEINEAVVDWYLSHDEDIDADTLYEARDYIAEKTLEIMEEEAEEA